MTQTNEPRPEHPSTYMVQDRASRDELMRVSIQDQLLTVSMGGVLPEQPDPTIFHRVLDVGCGTGGWLLEAAQTYPTMSLLVGVDVSRQFLAHAQAQAIARQVGDRIEFRAMDALRMLEFPGAFFDLVNQRLGSSYLRTWDWRKLLQEYARVLQPGGTLRITESDMVTESSSSAYVRFNQIIFQALNQAGHFFSPEPDGVTSQLTDLFQQRGFQNIQSRAHQLEYRAGTPQGQRYFEDARYASRTLKPFLQKWMRIPEDYEAICQQMLDEMQQPDFVAIWRFLTVWGTNPE